MCDQCMQQIRNIIYYRERRRKRLHVALWIVGLYLAGFAVGAFIYWRMA